MQHTAKLIDTHRLFPRSIHFIVRYLLHRHSISPFAGVSRHRRVIERRVSNWRRPLRGAVVLVAINPPR